MSQERTLKQRIGNYVIPRLPITKENFGIFRSKWILYLKYQEQDQSCCRIQDPSLQKKTDLFGKCRAGLSGKRDGSTSICLRWKMWRSHMIAEEIAFTDDSVSRNPQRTCIWTPGQGDEAPKFRKNAFGAWRQESAEDRCPGPGAFVRAYCSVTRRSGRKSGTIKILHGTQVNIFRCTDFFHSAGLPEQ